MERIFSAGSLVLLWFLFTIISTLLYVLIFCWGLRSGQFSRPKRCAALPLDSYIPEENGNCPQDPPEINEEPGKGVSL